MRKSKRVFVGIPISKKLQGFIISWTNENLKGKNLRIIPTANLHITLIPPWNEKETNIVADKLGKTTNAIRPFEIQFMTSSPPLKAGFPLKEDDISAFNSSTGLKPAVFLNAVIKLRLGPDKRHPRLIWVEGKKSEEVVVLRDHLEKLLDMKGEKRKFLPHITIARFGEKSYKKFELDRLNVEVDWKEKVESVCFYESKLASLGSQYKILKTVKFS